MNTLSNVPTMQLITMDRMQNTCIAVPDIDAYDKNLPKLKNHCFIFLKNSDQWKEIFFQEMKKKLKHHQFRKK